MYIIVKKQQHLSPQSAIHSYVFPYDTRFSKDYIFQTQLCHICLAGFIFSVFTPSHCWQTKSTRFIPCQVDKIHIQLQQSVDSDHCKPLTKMSVSVLCLALKFESCNIAWQRLHPSWATAPKTLHNTLLLLLLSLQHWLPHPTHTLFHNFALQYNVSCPLSWSTKHCQVTMSWLFSADVYRPYQDWMNSNTSFPTNGNDLMYHVAEAPSRWNNVSVGWNCTSPSQFIRLQPLLHTEQAQDAADLNVKLR